MYRKITAFLERWRESRDRKPLLLQGPSHVGKTYTVLEFGRTHYENVAYINFEINPRLKQVFDDYIRPEHLITILSHIVGQTIVPGRTLIALDEVQYCPWVVAALGYFHDALPAYHVIATGSLFDVAAAREHFKVPADKITFRTMQPMDMEEFMLALGEGALVGQIHRCFETNTPLPAVLHDRAMQYYKQYQRIVGGMPECVRQFADTKDYLLVRHTQETLVDGYLHEMERFCTAREARRTQQLYENMTTQLSRKSTRFQYNLVKKGGRASEFEGAIAWLTLSQLVTRVYRLSQICAPLEAHRDADAFKLYFSDVGLFCSQKNLATNDVLYMLEERGEFRGGELENYVQTQLTTSGHRTYYWESERGAEVDFIIERGGELIPIEVKSADNTKAKSLNVYIDTYSPSYAIKLSAGNFGFENDKKTVPLYAAFCI